MKKFTTIAQGYRFIFNSYENDGDHTNTIIKEGVSENEAKLLASLANALIARQTGLENEYDPSDKQKSNAYDVLWPIFEKHDNFFDQQDMEYFCGDVGVMVDYINENMLGHSEGYWLRALEDYEVQYVAQEVRMENVTSSFKDQK